MLQCDRYDPEAICRRCVPSLSCARWGAVPFPEWASRPSAQSADYEGIQRDGLCPKQHAVALASVVRVAGCNGPVSDLGNEGGVA
jgi:hypothetical protein